MFVIFATKPLNDGTKGFRFNVLGRKGLYRKRNNKTRKGISSGVSMVGYHYGKRSLYLEHGYSIRKLCHFAG
jgi:hypothetical protein|tara:strand:+ start:1014 stop:1229 length:216 start_codon:yes stop_codon:yes gene_type:complete